MRGHTLREPHQTGPRSTAAALTAVAIVGGLLIITAAATQTYAGTRWHGDIALYHEHALELVEGRLEPSPFLTWYPPLTLLPLALPLLAASALPLYTFGFALEMSALAGAGALLIRPVASHTRRLMSSNPLTSYAAFTLLCGFIIPLRYDMVPVMLVLAALAAAVSRRPLLAGVFLGLGAALKVFPAFLLPTLVAWYWFRADRRAAWLAAGGFFGAAGLGLATYLLFPPASPLDLLRFHSGRGLQLESLGGSIVAALSVLGLTTQSTVSFGTGFSFDLTGPTAEMVLAATKTMQPLALAALQATIIFLFHRARLQRQLVEEALILGMAMMLLGLMLTNSVLSAQYVVWLLPFVPFLGLRSRVVAFAAAALTTAIFPFAYDALISLAPAAVGLLVARNIALAALLGLVTLRLLRLTPIRHTGLEVTAAIGTQASGRSAP